ncbi:MAG: hypothetical protein COU45_06570 [Nitrosopumilus sp. CG10_big_fil_rev_8_21_14_0_10_33_7]|jgi:hypothetical protein|nr:MAG: hypothetical protein COU45_06570 [Nitrosopumilus sp. CG10_big_fil_rev_8_21_14_0_10_33_7]PIY88047.1 MAG: hypothetical protein COY74_10350 [Nitrosopumilales archaeon CG_4_10_14_0_8_um_filter_34_8]PJB96734.1 MAG: hypothetical protein CO079_09230 [Nitrosopumilales archaeon CG_4_9_14_0_8_um_filter_34_10]
MTSIEAYDMKIRKKVTMKNPKPYLMKNGSWALKGTSSATGITLFKIVGKKPSLSHSKLDYLKNMFTSRKCECDKFC